MEVIIAFAVTCACTPVAAATARRLGVVDRPGPLKVQGSPVPYLGGAAVLVGMVAALSTGHVLLLLPVSLAFAVGLADDVMDLPVATRLACEAVVCAAAVLVLEVHGVAEVAVVVVAVVLLLNAVNLLDGLDGLATGVSLVSATCFAVLLGGGGGDLAAVAAGALAGFALWNRPPARIYLGDSGSYLVGTALALLFATALVDAPASHASAAPLFVALPVGDTAVAIVRRWRAGRPLFSGDRAHVYDQLVDRGWRPGAVTAACISAQVVLGAAGLFISTLEASIAVVACVTIVTVTGIAALLTFARAR